MKSVGLWESAMVSLSASDLPTRQREQRREAQIGDRTQISLAFPCQGFPTDFDPTFPRTSDSDPILTPFVEIITPCVGLFDEFWVMGQHRSKQTRDGFDLTAKRVKP